MAPLGVAVLHGSGIADGVEHLLSSLDDALLLGADHAHEADRFVLDKLLADPPGVVFRVDLEGKDRQKRRRHDQQ